VLLAIGQGQVWEAIGEKASRRLRTCSEVNDISLREISLNERRPLIPRMSVAAKPVAA